MIEKLRTGSCPICSKPADERFRPFCSRRCADVDLNRWFSGVYVVPGREEEDEDGSPKQDSPKPDVAAAKGDGEP